MDVQDRRRRHRLASVPERIVYEVFNEIGTGEVSIVIHPRFMDLFEADFGLAHGPGPAMSFVEVFGMLQRGGAPCNAEAASYKRKADRKLATYAANGVSPTLIYLDDVCDPPRLRALLHQAMAQLGEASEDRSRRGLPVHSPRPVEWFEREGFCGGLA